MLRTGRPRGAGIPERGQRGGSGAPWGTPGLLGRRGRLLGRGGKRPGSGAPHPRARGAAKTAEMRFPRGGRRPRKWRSGVGPGEAGTVAIPRTAGRCSRGQSPRPYRGGGRGGTLLDFPARPGSGRARRGRGQRRGAAVVGTSRCVGRPPPQLTKLKGRWGPVPGDPLPGGL